VPDSSSIILFAHGARDPQWADPFLRIRDHLRAARPGIRVDVAFLQSMNPTLEEAVADHAAAGVTQVLVAPLFFGQGGHLKEDLPLLVARLKGMYPGVVVQVTPAAGEVEELVALIARWVLGEFLTLTDDAGRTAPPQTR
jgi:sirohydrochlorin cobaltochelatase